MVKLLALAPHIVTNRLLDSGSLERLDCAKLYPQNGERIVTIDSVMLIHQFISCVHYLVYTQGEVTSQNLWPRYDRHFVGKT